MILADKIIQLRKKMGWSQEELAEKMNVSRQSVSKWESTQSIPDIDRIIQMSQIFGVSTDYLLKDEVKMPTEFTDTYEPSEKKHITLDFANEFIDKSKASGRVIAIATFISICSPITLILLAVLSEIPSLGISENAAAAIGISALLVLIAIAVAMFIITGSAMQPYEFIKTSELELEYGVEGIILEKKKKYEATQTIATVIGVSICILGVIPLLITAIMEMPAYIIVGCVCALLFMIAIAVFIFIRFGSVYDSYKQLLQEEDYSSGAKEAYHSTEMVSKIYWGIIVAGYLGWSFISGEWRITWIVWPIAGILYGVYSAIMSLILKRDLND